MPCKICTFDTIPWHNSALNTLYHFCPHCECISLDTSLYLPPHLEKKIYDHHHNSLENEGYVRMFEAFLDFFWEEMSCRKTALDFGSGPTPVLSVLLQRRGLDVEGYDKFYQPNDTFKEHSYDLITSTEVFEHLQDPLNTLSFLTERLNEGGIIALMTLFHPQESSAFFMWWYRRDKTHITFFTPKTIQIMAKMCGLEMIKTDEKRIAILKKR